MIVVSDTSAITSLLQIGRVELLALVYEQVFIPDAVREELLQEHTGIPSFFHCQTVSDAGAVERLLVELDLGEAEAIVLAKELKAEDLLIDEAEGRRVAAREGVHAIGLLGAGSSERTWLHLVRSRGDWRVGTQGRIPCFRRRQRNHFPRSR